MTIIYNYYEEMSRIASVARAKETGLGDFVKCDCLVAELRH